MFIPTFSGMDYPEISIIFIIASTLIMILSSQSRLGEKCNILIERISELWNGNNTKENQKKTSSKKNNQSSTNTSPQQQPASQKILPSHNPNSYSDGTSINNLPNVDNNPNSPPDFNKFYLQDNTPLVNAAMPTEGYENGGIMAANEVLGGSGGFSSW